MFNNQNNQVTWIKYVCVISVICLQVIEGIEEQSISINKPVIRSDENWMHFATDHVRCFCNLPSCVTTGYMCKSKEGCFSDLLENASSRSSYRGRHGCVELLTDRDKKNWCFSPENNTRPPYKRKHPKSLLVCCKNDMCNHVDNPQTKSILNNTLLEQILEDSTSDNNKYQSNHQEPFLYSNSEVWFRAATIAVPICGAVILFVLIALAVKILRSENPNSPNHKLGPAMYVHHVPSQSKVYCEKYHENFERSYDVRNQYVPIHNQNHFFRSQSDEIQRQIQVPLLLQNENFNKSDCLNKNENHAKLNKIKHDDVVDYLEKNTGNSEINIVKNINNEGYDEQKISKDKPNL